MSSIEKEDAWWEGVPLIPFHSHASFCLSGTTNSGKTTWIQKLIRYRQVMFATPPDRVVYCYGIWQKAFEEMERRENTDLSFQQGLPTPDLWEESEHTLLILDDLAREVVSNPEMEKIFTRGTHHKGLTCLFVTQNLFMGGKHARTIALNTTYNILFRNPRDVSQVQTFGRQLFPGKGNVFQEAFRDATSAPYGYLVVDLSPNIENERYRLRTSVFPGEFPIIYHI